MLYPWTINWTIALVLQDKKHRPERLLKAPLLAIERHMERADKALESEQQAIEDREDRHVMQRTLRTCDGEDRHAAEKDWAKHLQPE